MVRVDEWLSAGEPVPAFVDGRWRSAGAGELAVHAPATGERIGVIGYGGPEAALAAADAAAAAFADWAGAPARFRADILSRAGELLSERAQPLGRLLARETGKRLPEAIAEVLFACEFLRWYAEEARRPQGEVLTVEDPGRRHLTLSRPVGVAVCLTPWNFPVSIPARKLAAALAAGCSVVCRASEKAPLAVLELFAVLEEAGLPPGVANAIHGPAESQVSALLHHPAVRVVSFTGSTLVGSHIMELASHRVVRCALELGGNAPFLVFSDADLDAAVQGLLIAKFRNNGQSCVAANRVYVQNSVHEEFVERLATAVSKLSVGDPLAGPTPDVGPLIDRGRVEAVTSLVDEALAGGARWIGPSVSLPLGGNYTRPGFLQDLPADCRLATTEVFGPVAGVLPFHDEEEALALANASEMGLAAYVYTRDVARAWRVVEKVEAGIVGLNHPVPPVAFAPMGGVKQSGMGREGGRRGLEEYLDTRYVAIGVDRQ